MGRGPKKMPEALVKEWHIEGRGEGEGANYKPWLKTFDIFSGGRVIVHDPLHTHRGRSAEPEARRKKHAKADGCARFRFHELGVPILFVGTNKAVEVLGLGFRQGRRSVGGGFPDRGHLSASHDLKEPLEWEDFITTLWAF